MWIARLLWVWIVPVLLLVLLSRAQENKQKAMALNAQRIEFTPSKLFHWASCLFACLFAIYAAYAAAAHLKHSHGRPDIIISICVGILGPMILYSLPGTIAVTADGIEQAFWFQKNRHIRWADIVEINSDEKSRTVSITGADGTKIVHSRQLADRSRLLLELKQHCGENLPPDFPCERIAGF